MPDAKVQVLVNSVKKGPGPVKARRKFPPLDLSHPLLQKIKHITNLARVSNRPETNKFRQNILAAFAQCGFSRQALEEVGFVVGKKVWKNARENRDMVEGMKAGLTHNKPPCEIIEN